MKKLAQKDNSGETTNTAPLDAQSDLGVFPIDDQSSNNRRDEINESDHLNAIGITPYSPPPEGLNGLIDPEKSNNPDTIHISDLTIARNLRRLEIHRYEIATALENLSDEEVGEFLVNEEDEIELLEVDLSYANHIQELKKNRRKKQQLDPDQFLSQILDNMTQGLKHSSGNLAAFLKFNRFTPINHTLRLKWHQKLYDQTIEKRLFIPFDAIKHNNSSNHQDETSNHDIAHPSMPCAPVALVQWSLDCLAHYQEGNSFRHFYFIDPACGHGRTLLMASHKDFRAILGIEARKDLSEKALMNIAQYPKSFMAQREVKLNSATQLSEQWPNHPLLIHIFQPESSAWLSELLESLSASFAQSPRQIYIVMIDNQYKDILEDIPFLHPFKPATQTAQKKSYLNPYEVDFYYSKINQ